jgi:hypothetical protein
MNDVYHICGYTPGVTRFPTIYSIHVYPALVLFEQSNCIDWIIVVIYGHGPQYTFPGN